MYEFQGLTIFHISRICVPNGYDVKFLLVVHLFIIYANIWFWNMTLSVTNLGFQINITQHG